MAGHTEGVSVLAGFSPLEWGWLWQETWEYRDRENSEICITCVEFLKTEVAGICWLLCLTVTEAGVYGMGALLGGLMMLFRLGR